MLLQSCSQYQEIHSHVHSLHKNHMQKKKSTANWDQIPSPTRKQGTTTGFISHFAKKKTNPDELYSETWKPPAWKAAKPCLSSVTPCGVAIPSPYIPSSSEIQQFSAKMGEKMKKINLYIPSCQTWELAEQRVAHWAAGEENGEKKNGKVCRNKTSPAPVAQPHRLPSSTIPSALAGCTCKGKRAPSSSSISEALR